MSDKSAESPPRSNAESAAGATRFMFDKRIPLAALVAFLIQFGGFIWYASQQDARVASTERLMVELQSKTTTLEGKAADLVLVNFRLTAVEGGINRIEDKVDKLSAR